MKITPFVLLSLLFPCLNFSQTRQVLPLKPDCDSLLHAGDKHMSGKRLELAMQCYLGALNCDSRLAGQIGPRIDLVFKGIKQQKDDAIEAKNQAETEARRNLASDLAYKSKTALRDGDRTTAFRLAELAYRYVDAHNYKVTQALIDAYYCNEVEGKSPLFWNAVIDQGGYTTGLTAYSANGKRLATVSIDLDHMLKVKVRDMETCKVVYTYQSVTDELTSISLTAMAFSPDAAILALGFEKGAIKVIDLNQKKELRSFTGHSDQVNCLGFAPDAQWLASGADDGKMILWDWREGRIHQVISRNFGDVRALLFTHDGKSLIANGPDYASAVLWNTVTGDTVRSFDGKKGAVKCLAYSENKELLATGTSDGEVFIWKVKTGEKLFEFIDNKDVIHSIAFSPDGNLLAAGSENSVVKIWDTSTGAQVYTLPHDAAVMHVFFSADGGQLITSGSISFANAFQNVVRLWDLHIRDTTHNILLHKTGVRCLDFSSNGRWIATGSENKVSIWDWSIPKIIQSYEEGEASITGVVFSHIHHWLVYATSNGRIKVWDWKQDRLLADIECSKMEISAICFSPDERFILSASGYEPLKIWDWRKSTRVQLLGDGQQDASCVAFSPDGTFAAAGFSDGTVKVWNKSNGKLKFPFGKQLEDGANPVNKIVFSPTEDVLAAAYSDNQIKIWNLKTGRLQKILTGHTTEIESLDFSPDGKLLASCTKDPVIKFFDQKLEFKVWDVSTGLEAFSLPGHLKSMTGLKFSPDGQRIASSSLDGTVKIWELNPENMRVKIGKSLIPASLSWKQIRAFNLTEIFNLNPENENVLKQSKDPDLISAFADALAGQNLLDVMNIMAGDTLELVNYNSVDFARAERLYRAMIKAGGDAIQRYKLGRLYRHWAYSLIHSDNPEAARPYIEQACRFSADKSICPGLWSDFAETTGRPFHTNTFLTAEDPVELKGFGDYFFFRTSDWRTAGLLYEKAERIRHDTSNLTKIYLIYKKTGQAFDLQRFLSSDNPEELIHYGDFLFDYGLGDEDAKQLYGKALSKSLNSYTLYRLLKLDEKNKREPDLGILLKKENSSYIDLFVNYALGDYRWDTDPQTLSLLEKVLLLREAQLKADSNTVLKHAISGNYRKLAMCQLAQKDAAAAGKSLDRAGELDPDNLDVQIYKIVALIFQNQLQEAERQLQDWKSRIYDRGKGETFKDAFLKEIEALENQSIDLRHPDFAKVRDFLNN